MSKDNNETKVSKIIVPEDGSVILVGEFNAELEISYKQFSALSKLIQGETPKIILEVLRKGFMDIVVYALTSENQDIEVPLEKEFVEEYYSLCSNLESLYENSSIKSNSKN